MKRNTRIDLFDHLFVKFLEMSTTIDLDLVECEAKLVCECEIARACSTQSSLVNETPSALPMTTELKGLHWK